MLVPSGNVSELIIVWIFTTTTEYLGTAIQYK